MKTLEVVVENPEHLNVIVGQTQFIDGVVDGESARGIETEAQVAERRAVVRRFGYKL